MKGWKLKRDRDVGAIPGVRRKGVGRGIMVERRVFAHMEMIRTLRLFTEQQGGGEGGREGWRSKENNAYCFGSYLYISAILNRPTKEREIQRKRGSS